MSKSLAFILAALLACVSIASAEEETKKWAVDTEVGFYNQYMWRGLRLYRGTSIQPSVTAAYNSDYGTFSGNLWMHVTGDSDKTAERFTELDETIEYGNTFGPATIAVGNSWYTYTDTGDGTNILDSAEVYFTVSFDAPLTPSFSFYHDWRAIDWYYYEIGISHDLENLFGEGGTVTPFAAIGFASNSEKAYADDGLEQITVGASSELTMGSIGVVPSVNYSFKIDDNTVNQFWFALTFKKSF